MIDSHCHLDLPIFCDDLKQVINRAKQAGITRMHIPGTTVKGWSRQQRIAQQYNEIDFSLGLHPYFLDQDWNNNLRSLEEKVDAYNSLLAIGEIGLDSQCQVDLGIQTKVFERQLILANQYKLPVILHHRKTHHAIFAALKKTGFGYGGIVHAFSGSLDVAKAYIDKGFLLGIGGVITYERASKTRSTLTQVPLADLVLETDSPDMPMCGLQGRRNEPANLNHVVNALSELKTENKDTIEQVTNANYERIFGLR